MKRRWHHGSFKQNRNLRFGKDIIWEGMKRRHRQRIAELNAQEQVKEYEESLQECSCYDDYDYDDYYVYHPPDEDLTDLFFDDDLFDDQGYEEDFSALRYY